MSLVAYVLGLNIILTNALNTMSLMFNVSNE